MGAVDARERYQPDTKLEAGLGGERWVATDTQTGKTVVLSVLDARAATDSHRTAFETWTRVGATVNHPSLETVLASGETALGNPYFVTEVIENETLAQRIVREPAMSLHELVRVVTAVVDGLVVAHKLGVSHGDLSPERIHLLPGGRARLVGFGLNRGIARAHDSTRESPNVPATDAFMSPEQARGGAPSASADLWGVAAILYRGFCGVAPRALEDGRSTVASIADGPTLPVETLREDAPPSFATLLEKGLAAESDARFRDVGELRKALTSALILAPIIARMPVYAAPEGTGESRSSLEPGAPSLPPPPSRPQTGIGPLGARTNQRTAPRIGSSRWATGRAPSGAPTTTPLASSRPAASSSTNTAPKSVPPPAPPSVVTSPTYAVGKVNLVKSPQNSRGAVREVNVAPRRVSAVPPPPPPPRVKPASGRMAAVSDPPPPLRPLDDAERNRTSMVDDDDGVVTSFGAAGLFWPSPTNDRPSRKSFAPAVIDVDDDEPVEDAELLEDELDETTDDDVDAAIASVSSGDVLPSAKAAVAAAMAEAAELAQPTAPLMQPNDHDSDVIASTPLARIRALADATEPAPVVVPPIASVAPLVPNAAGAGPRSLLPLPPKAWVSIGIFAVGFFAAAFGFLRFMRSPSSEEVRIAPTIESRASDSTHAQARLPSTDVQAAVIDAGSPAPVDASVAVVAPPIPEELLPPPTTPLPSTSTSTPTTGAPRTPRVPRPSNTTTSASTTTVSTTPMTTPPMTTEAPMTTPMTSTHALERDPGF